MERLVRKGAERFSLGNGYMTRALNDLTGWLEEYRLRLLKERQAQIRDPRANQLTEEEENTALEFLKSPDLLSRTNEMIAQSGVVSEEVNRLLMYLVFTSRKTEFPLHVITQGQSGVGKTYLQEKIGELMPEEDLIELTTLSDNALFYFEQRELRGKLLLIEDLDGSETSMYPLRELMSKRYITKAVAVKTPQGYTRTRHLKVEGPVTVAGCTTRQTLYEDNANRCFLIQVDQSPQQDERVMQYQRAVSAGKVNRWHEESARRLLQNCQRVLEPVLVRNPFAESLIIPPEVFKPRRTNAHYLRFIEAITFYMQFQRTKKVDPDTGEIYIETTLEDIRNANKLVEDVLLQKSDTLPHATREYFEVLKKHIGSYEEKAFTSKEIAIILRIPISTVKRYHLQLMNGGFLKTQPRKKGEKSRRYEIINMEEYRDLKKRVNNVLRKALRQIENKQKLTGSVSAQ